MHKKNVSTVQQPIRSYLRIFPSAGLDPASESDFEILDGNCYLDKRNPSNLQVYPFNFIFNNEFDNLNIIQHMNLVDDAFQGKNQYLIAEIQKENIMNFIVGNCENKGFMVELADLLFYQTISHGLKNDSSASSKTLKRIQTKQKLGLSIFATEGCTNNFHDLILGQRLSYFSKKDMDEYKNFYTHQIDSIQQFLIILKIGLIHYRERCRQDDPLIFRFFVSSYDEPNCTFYQSYLHIIITERFSKISSHIIKKIQNSLSHLQNKGEDHGSIANYFEKDLKKCKLIYLYGIPFRYRVILQSKDRFEFLGNIRQHIYKVTKNQKNIRGEKLIKQINLFRVTKFAKGTNNMGYKQINLMTNLLNKLNDFLTQTSNKWKNYCSTINEIILTQNQFYQKLRFPVGLEIKDQNFKNFLISKVYRLSENFQIQDLTIQFQKLRTIKNQILLSFKSLLLSKEVFNQSNSHKTSGTILDHETQDSVTGRMNSQKLKNNKSVTIHQQNRTKYFKQFIEYFTNNLENLHKILKQLFNLNITSLRFQEINLFSDVDQMIFDGSMIKQSISRIKKDAHKKDKHKLQKQEILLRKIQTSELNMLSNYINQNSNFIQNSFDEFQKLKSSNNREFSKGASYSNNSKRNKLENISLNFLAGSKPLPKVLYPTTPTFNNQYDSLPDQQKNKFSLPKIAVIHKKNSKIL